MKPRIRIDIVSDVVCPWCYIGKKRLEKAMETLSGDFDFDVSYIPFELNPGVPQSGLDQKTYLTEKFGGRERYEELVKRVTEVAAMEGIQFDYSAQQVMPNTRKSHALIAHAATKGLHVAMTEILFNAYFTSGIDLSKEENLLMAAQEAGLDEAETRNFLKDNDQLNSIAEREEEMSKLGITGVPFFIINSKYGISGAQYPETFETALRDIGKEPLLQGEVCDTNKSNC
jgi:predicted DsbA family dithiol-disulfide isomerase